jgi:hypothetical protein
VRRHLLAGFVRHKLISSATREDFRDGGFLFDHAIRCQLKQDLIRCEAELAKVHKSQLVSQSVHLAPIIIANASKVWIMGYLALAAVSKISSREIGWIYGIPSNGQSINSKYFLSQYFNRFSKASQIDAILTNFREFLIK